MTIVDIPSEGVLMKCLQSLLHHKVHILRLHHSFDVEPIIHLMLNLSCGSLANSLNNGSHTLLLRCAV